MSRTSPDYGAADELISLSPSDLLTFPLVRDTAPRTTLRITNVSDARVIFKVKTTQPTWYYVRPNQHVLDIGKTEEITIILVEAECNRFLDQFGTPNEEKLDKHRFLVQSTIISDDVFDKIASLSHQGRHEEYQRIWDSATKEEKKNQKLRVEFLHPQDNADLDANEAPASIPQNVENIRNKIGKVDTSAVSKTSLEDMPGTPDSIFAELQSLRKKYDAVVEYTVHLTAERDYHFSQLEELKREFAREKSRKAATDTPNKKMDKNTEKRVVQEGYSLFTMILVALIAFFAARFFQTS